MTGRDGGTNNIRKCARVIIRHLAAQSDDLGGKYGLGAHDFGKALEASLMIRALQPLENPPVDESAGKSNPNPHTRLSGLRESLRHYIVKGPIQVWQRDVNHDPGNGVYRRRFGYRLGLSFADRTGDQR